MDHLKLDQADLNSPRQELFNGGHGFVIALQVFSGVNFLVHALGVQSICNSDVISVSM